MKSSLKVGLWVLLLFCGCATNPWISDGLNEYRLVVPERIGADGFTRIALYERRGVSTNVSLYMLSQHWVPGDNYVFMRVVP